MTIEIRKCFLNTYSKEYIVKIMENIANIFKY